MIFKLIQQRTLPSLLALTALAAVCGAQAQTTQGSAVAQPVSTAPVIYPAKGQTQKQQEQDKFACYEWGRAQSGFDPAQAQTPAPMPQQTQTAQQQPQQQQVAQSQSTGSMVRGAARGAAVGELVNHDAGKGAAIGVLGSAVVDRARQQQQAAARQQQAAAQQQQQAQAQQQQQMQAQQQAARAQQQQRAVYDRAFGVCMEARGYAVR